MCARVCVSEVASWTAFWICFPSESDPRQNTVLFCNLFSDLLSVVISAVTVNTKDTDFVLGERPRAEGPEVFGFIKMARGAQVFPFASVRPDPQASHHLR